MLFTPAENGVVKHSRSEIKTHLYVSTGCPMRFESSLSFCTLSFIQHSNISRK